MSRKLHSLAGLIFGLVLAFLAGTGAILSLDPALERAQARSSNGAVAELAVKVAGEADTIGVAGLFRAPHADRWKLAFDARRSADSGIVVGAHACALTAGAGTLLTDAGATASLAGVQCNR